MTKDFPRSIEHTFIHPSDVHNKSEAGTPHLDADHQSALDVGPLVQEIQHEQLGALLLGGLGAPVALIHDLQAARWVTWKIDIPHI